MQRVSSFLPAWNGNRATNPKVNSLDKVRGWTDRIPSSTNRRSLARLSTNALLPGSMDKECEKAARIIRSFCSDGFATADDRPGTPSTYSSGHSNQLLRKIPPMIIQNAVGLAVFTTMRSGIWSSGSGGSGILIARKTDGTWSPPSGLLLHTAGLGLSLGVDVYDCILVINNFTVLEAFARPSLTLGTGVALTPGPLVSLGLLENDLSWTDLSDSAITYVKSGGQLADFKLDGTILNERTEENDRFYGMRIGVAKILSGDINQSMPQTRLLTEMLKVAEGRTDFDATLIEQYSGLPSPGDATIETPQSAVTGAFGVPTQDDPDPFGVMALEMAGLEIREAGTRQRPESRHFEYAPSPTSPIFSKVGRRSVDTYLSRSNRGSSMSNKTVATEKSHLSQMTDTGTQTCNTAETTPSPSQSQSEDGISQPAGEVIAEVQEPEEIDYTKIDISALRKLSNFPDLEEPQMTPAAPIGSHGDGSDGKQDANEKDTASTASPEASHTDIEDQATTHESDSDGLDEADDEEDDDDEFEDAEEAVVYEVATAQAPQRMAMTVSQGVQAKGAVVTIPRRIPPPLPSRSPARMSRRKSQMTSSSMVQSPLRQSFDVDPVVSEGSSTPKAEDNVETSTGSISSVAVSHQGESNADSSDTGGSERASTPTNGVRSRTNTLSEVIENPIQESDRPVEQHEPEKRPSIETRRSSGHEGETLDAPEAGRGVPVLAA